MSYPIQAESLEWPDKKLGAYLLHIWAAECAEFEGAPFEHFLEHQAAWTERARLAALRKEIKTTANVAIEKALHKAASGEFEAAGRLYRDYLLQGAMAYKFIPLGIAKAKQSDEFLKSGSDQSRAVGDANRAAVLAAARAVIDSREKGKRPLPSQRELAALVCKRLDGRLSVEAVRGHLKASYTKKSGLGGSASPKPRR
jgi:hypothetical protein